MNYTFELKELQATHIVYLHHQGDISFIPSSIRKLMQWAGPKGLITGPANKLISVYQHEGKELRSQKDYYPEDFTRSGILR